MPACTCPSGPAEGEGRESELELDVLEPGVAALTVLMEREATSDTEEVTTFDGAAAIALVSAPWSSCRHHVSLSLPPTRPFDKTRMGASETTLLPVASVTRKSRLALTGAARAASEDQDSQRSSLCLLGMRSAERSGDNSPVQLHSVRARPSTSSRVVLPSRSASAPLEGVQAASSA